MHSRRRTAKVCAWRQDGTLLKGKPHWRTVPTTKDQAKALAMARRSGNADR
jgi:hypothetical protein